MQPDFDNMSMDELLTLKIRYKRFIEDEPNTTVAELFRQRLTQIRLAIKRKEKAARQCG